jgi:hypothetical protein
LKAIIEMEDPASKARFNDVEFLEESEEMIEDLKRIVDESVKYGGQQFVDSQEDDEEENDDDDDDEGEGERDIPKFVVGSVDSGGSSSSSSARKPKIASFFDEDVDSGASDSEDDKNVSK